MSASAGRPGSPWAASTARAHIMTRVQDHEANVETIGDDTACPFCSGLTGDAVRHPEVCRFIAGSLYCIKADCRNPHHRLDPSTDIPPF